MRQKFLLYQLQFIFALHQLSHDTLDPHRSFDKTVDGQEAFAYYLGAQTYYLGVNVSFVLLGLYVLNLNCYVTIPIYIFTQVMTLSFVNSHDYYGQLFYEFLFTSSYCVFASLAIYYQNTKEQKEKFLSDLKIQRLLVEQRNIFDNMPDGVLIHQNKINESPI